MAIRILIEEVRKEFVGMEISEVSKNVESLKSCVTSFIIIDFNYISDIIKESTGIEGKESLFLEMGILRLLIQKDDEKISYLLDESENVSINKNDYENRKIEATNGSH